MCCRSHVADVWKGHWTASFWKRKLFNYAKRLNGCVSSPAWRGQPKSNRAETPISRFAPRSFLSGSPVSSRRGIPPCGPAEGDPQGLDFSLAIEPPSLMYAPSGKDMYRAPDFFGQRFGIWRRMT